MREKKNIYISPIFIRSIPFINMKSDFLEMIKKKAEAVREIQEKVKSKQCIVNENFEKLQLNGNILIEKNDRRLLFFYNN